MIIDALRSYRSMSEDVRNEMRFHKYVELKREDACLFVGYARKQNTAKDLKDKLTVHKSKGDTCTPNELEKWIQSWKTISASIPNQMRSVLSLPTCTCRTMPTRGGIT